MSNSEFPYTFTADEGITFGEITPPAPFIGDWSEGDLRIYYDSQNDTSYISCDCSRWDVDNYSVIVETWLNKSQLQYLQDNMTPGAVAELYNILGKPFYYDKTWTASNIIKLTPSYSSNSNLKLMRRDTLIYPKTITSSPIKGDKGFINVKIEGYISGNQDL